mmetsp:Transcript_1687/g.4084  ORF Transcript_1687/g.4084 Transcript_1687/m.4084 type:complete len:269 (-) Transcript_1687:225-1031(-)
MDGIKVSLERADQLGGQKHVEGHAAQRVHGIAVGILSKIAKVGRLGEGQPHALHLAGVRVMRVNAFGIAGIPASGIVMFQQRLEGLFEYGCFHIAAMNGQSVQDGFLGGFHGWTRSLQNKGRNGRRERLHGIAIFFVNVIWNLWLWRMMNLMRRQCQGRSRSECCFSTGLWLWLLCWWCKCWRHGQMQRRRRCGGGGTNRNGPKNLKWLLWKGRKCGFLLFLSWAVGAVGGTWIFGAALAHGFLPSVVLVRHGVICLLLERPFSMPIL